MIIKQITGNTIDFLSGKEYFRSIIVIQNIWKETGWGMIIFLAALAGVDVELYEAAKVDGAGYMRQYCSIMIPLMGPAIAAQVIFMFVGNWNDFFAPSIYLMLPESQTLQVMLQSISRGNPLNLPIVFAGAVIASAPLYVIYLVFQRYFVEGLAISGVKG